MLKKLNHGILEICKFPKHVEIVTPNLDLLGDVRHFLLFLNFSSVCGVCILKREHHCMFAGYCVGHFNHRFFVLFLAWLWLGVLYCTYLNSLYVWTEFENVSLSAMFKFVFPLLILMSGMDLSWTQVISCR